MDYITIEGTQSQLEAALSVPDFNIFRRSSRELPNGKFAVDGLATADAQTALSALGLIVTAVIPETEINAHDAKLDAEIALGTSYGDSAQLNAALDNLKTTYSATLSHGPDGDFEVFKLPNKSSGGPLPIDSPKDIKAIRIGTGDIPVLIVAGLHARELAPPDAVIAFAEKLMACYASFGDTIETEFVDGPFTSKVHDEDYEYQDIYSKKIDYQSMAIPQDELKAMVSKLKIFLVPCANPDGRDYSLSQPDRKYWRTNRKVINSYNPCSKGPEVPIGVDINRNFPVAFDMDAYYKASVVNHVKNHTADTPCDDDKYSIRFWNKHRVKGINSYKDRDTYQGENPLSENESLNIQGLIDEHKIRYFLDIHSAIRVIILPWGFNQNQLTFESSTVSDTWLNKTLDVGGGGVGRDIGGVEIGGAMGTYREYFPHKPNHHLLLKHYMLASLMSWNIFKAAGSDEHAKKRAKYRLVNPEQKGGLYPATGSAMDYALSTQLKLADGSLTDAAIVEDRFPVIALSVEVGHASDGRWFPLKNDDDRKQYRKVQRETFAAMRGFLSYASRWSTDLAEAFFGD